MLFCSYTLDAEEKEKLDRFLSLFDESGVAEIIRGHETLREGHSTTSTGCSLQ
ncbi:MAG: hypothetical protein ACI4S4_05125 [Candidatus Ornithospirochaeta sp.]